LLRTAISKSGARIQVDAGLTPFQRSPMLSAETARRIIHLVFVPYESAPVRELKQRKTGKKR
jgi:hypothetical protein